MAAEEQFTASQMLSQVNQAITNIMVGGQSYQIGSRKLTRADLSTLRAMKKELEAQVNAEGSSELLDNTYLNQIDAEARDREEQLVKQMMEKEGITEELKRQDNMEWTRRMNTLCHDAEEMILTEMIYTKG